MVTFNNLVSFLTVAAAVVANPIAVINDEGFPLEAHAGQIYTCKRGDANNGALIGYVSQDKSIGYFREAKTQTGTASGYPKPFGNKGNVLKFASGCGSDVWELPVLNNSVRFDFNKKINKGKANENNPGPMRGYYTPKISNSVV
ncbi:hypothetical protein GQ53DRAFT_886479 [Thozetella sp. PMI_491]|nr:hypothetical protein GQ53DRAFT_886479 [Thozetella sp. PMI_491]